MRSILAFFAARAPAEIPDLAEHTGTVTVTHGNALLDARMDEADSAKLIELLAHARFSPNEEAQIQDYSGGIRILFADGGEITLLRGEEKVFARAVNAAGETGYYTVSTDVYEQVRLHIYTVFSDGVTFEELQPWWDEYFYIAQPDPDGFRFQLGPGDPAGISGEVYPVPDDRGRFR